MQFTQIDLDIINLLRQAGQIGLEGKQVLPTVKRGRVAYRIYKLEKLGLVRRTKKWRGQVTWFIV